MEGEDEEKKMKILYNNMELLEKSLSRYEGNRHEISEWKIIIHVIQGKDFAGLDINPYICIQIGDQKCYTAAHRCTNSPFFGEFFTFEFTLPATQMLDKVIYFKLHHAKQIVSMFTHTKPIGIFKVDISTVYNEKEHAFKRKWAQLVNPDSVQVPCGHLLLSMAVSERGLPTKNILSKLSEEDDEFKPSEVFVPAAMPRDLFSVQLRITFFAAEDIPEMMTDFSTSFIKKIFHSDKWEPVDPYVEVTYNTMQVTTNHRNNTAPVWLETLCLIGSFPPLVRKIKITLKDHSTVQQDRTISSFFIDLFQIGESNPFCCFLPTLGPTWMFLYGSPREYTSNKDHDGLSQGMGEGICYKLAS